ncbi:MAG: MipA/OmpV family protein [Calditrichaeota bacterium]|nr:MAG: MipA/OmpV family protein [Calditrichota bacterium]
MRIKSLFITLFVCFPVLAGDFIKPAYGLWAVGMSVSDRNYTGTTLRYTPAPLIFGGYGPVWIEANRLGYTFFRSHGWFASVAAQLRTHQFRKDDKELSDRRSALEAGLQVGKRLFGNWVLRLALLQDVSGAHKSREADVQLYTHFFPGPFSLLTAVGVQYQTAALTNFYYGTHDYKPRAGFVTELESILTLPLGNWGVFVGLRYWFFDKQAASSPIANGNRISTLFTGIGYYFD